MSPRWFLWLNFSVFVDVHYFFFVYLDRHNKPIAAPQADEYSDDDDDYEAWGEFDEFGSSVSISR